LMVLKVYKEKLDQPDCKVNKVSKVFKVYKVKQVQPDCKANKVYKV